MQWRDHRVDGQFSTSTEWQAVSHQSPTIWCIRDIPCRGFGQRRSLSNECPFRHISMLLHSRAKRRLVKCGATWAVGVARLGRKRSVWKRSPWSRAHALSITQRLRPFVKVMLQFSRNQRTICPFFQKRWIWKSVQLATQMAARARTSGSEGRSHQKLLQGGVPAGRGRRRVWQPKPTSSTTG